MIKLRSAKFEFVTASAELTKIDEERLAEDIRLWLLVKKGISVRVEIE